MSVPPADNYEKLSRAVSDLRDALATEAAIRKEEHDKNTALIKDTMIALVRNTHEFLETAREERDLAKILVDRDKRSWLSGLTIAAMLLGAAACFALVIHALNPWHGEAGARIGALERHYDQINERIKLMENHRPPEL